MTMSVGFSRIRPIQGTGVVTRPLVSWTEPASFGVVDSWIGTCVLCCRGQFVSFGVVDAPKSVSFGVVDACVLWCRGRSEICVLWCPSTKVEVTTRRAGVGS